MVLNAGEEAGMQALNELCRLYWRPLQAYCCSLGSSVSDAEDLTQGFFAQMVSRGSLRLADPQRGRFRAFLLTSFKNHLASMYRHRSAEKRGGGMVPRSLDEEEMAAPATGEPGPEQAYDRQWAEDLVARATQALRAEQQAQGRAEWFEKIMGNKAARDYAQAAAELGCTEDAVKSFAFRVRKRFRFLLEREIADTVTTPEEAVAEMRYLATLLRG